MKLMYAGRALLMHAKNQNKKNVELFIRFIFFQVWKILIRIFFLFILVMFNVDILYISYWMYCSIEESMQELGMVESCED